MGGIGRDVGTLPRADRATEAAGLPLAPTGRVHDFQPTQTFIRTTAGHNGVEGRSAHGDSHAEC